MKNSLFLTTILALTLSNIVVANDQTLTTVTLTLKGTRNFIVANKPGQELIKTSLQAFNECKEVFSEEHCNKGKLKTLFMNDGSAGAELSVKKQYTSVGCTSLSDCNEVTPLLDIISAAIQKCAVDLHITQCEQGKITIDTPAKRNKWKQ